MNDWLKKRRHFTQTALRLAVFAAAVSLFAYVPYRYLTHPPALRGLYGFLFPLSPLLAIAGFGIAIDARTLLKLPLLVRAVIVTLAVLWLAAGIVCVPLLLEEISMAPGRGLAASFQMLAQHIFLSSAVAGALLVPEASQKWLGKTVAGHLFQPTGRCPI